MLNRWAKPHVGRTGMLVRPGEKWGQWIVKFDNEEVSWKWEVGSGNWEVGCLQPPLECREDSTPSFFLVYVVYLVIYDSG